MNGLSLGTIIAPLTFQNNEGKHKTKVSKQSSKIVFVVVFRDRLMFKRTLWYLGKYFDIPSMMLLPLPHADYSGSIKVIRIWFKSLKRVKIV